jgi:hypothetical protein
MAMKATTIMGTTIAGCSKTITHDDRNDFDDNPPLTTQHYQRRPPASNAEPSTSTSANTMAAEATR